MRLRFQEMALIVLISLCGCGYRFIGQTNPLDNYGLRKIYIPTAVNHSREPGLEYFVATSFRNTFSHARGLEVVSNQDDADAILHTTVSSINSLPGSTLVGTKDTENAGGLPEEVTLAKTFTTEMTITANLTSKGKTIWNGTINRSRTFEGSTHLDSLRSSNALTNDSRESITIQLLCNDIATQIRDQLMEAF